MARSRNIKPGFFKNEDLAECSPWVRLCFVGLWTLADREGRLEDRHKRIKGELFPFDTIEVEPLLVELERWRFIKRYQVADGRYIQIVKFVEHQAPHGTEKDSTIPNENGYLTTYERNKNGFTTGGSRLVHHSVTVDDGIPAQPDNSYLTVNDSSPRGGHNSLIPDSLIRDSEPAAKTHTDLLRTGESPPVCASPPTPSGLVCLAMRDAGIADTNPSHPVLLALLDAGATPGEFGHAAALAIRKGKPDFNYALGIVKKQRDDAEKLGQRQGAPPAKGRAAAVENFGKTDYGQGGRL